MSYQQIADASGISKSSVVRILQKNGQNPTVQTIADIAAAVGYDLDVSRAPQLEDHTKDAYIRFLHEPLEAEKRLAEKRLEQQQASYHRQLAEKSRVIRYLAMSLILVITFLVTWLIIDVTHPNIGWFQREAYYYGGSGIQHVLAAICRWLGM